MGELVSIEWLLGSAVVVIVWLVRLEAKTLQNEKDIESVKDEAASVNKEMLREMKELSKAFHELDKNIVVVMQRIEHMNTKITHLERNKVAPILEEYFKREE